MDFVLHVSFIYRVFLLSRYIFVIFNDTKNRTKLFSFQRQIIFWFSNSDDILSFVHYCIILYYFLYSSIIVYNSILQSKKNAFHAPCADFSNYIARYRNCVYDLKENWPVERLSLFLNSKCKYHFHLVSSYLEYIQKIRVQNVR